MFHPFVRIYRFYAEGFRGMTWGRTLWLIILIKLFVMFGILRLFFFQPVLSGKSENEKQSIVAERMNGAHAESAPQQGTQTLELKH